MKVECIVPDFGSKEINTDCTSTVRIEVQKITLQGLHTRLRS